MKKLLFAAGLMAMWSCSDVEFENKPDASARLATMTLFDFDESLLENDLDEDWHNKNAIQAAIDYVEAHPELYQGMEIGPADCYVNGLSQDGTPRDMGLRIPKNFTLVMSDDTHLRLSHYNTVSGDYALIKVGWLGQNDENTIPKNVNIIGGHLYGNRRHVEDTILRGTVMRIFSSDTVTVDGVEIVDGNADNLVVSGGTISLPSGGSFYHPPTQVKIKNCIFKNGRRCNMTIADGHEIEIENNEFIEGGQFVDKGNGLESIPANPRSSLNIEGDRIWYLGELHWYKHPHNIQVRHNKESGSFAKSLYVGLGNYVTISDNETEATIGYTYGDNVQILNNKVDGQNRHDGMNGGHPSTTEVIHSNLFSGNKIINCRAGLRICNNKTLITGNIIDECMTGITFQSVTAVTIERNRIASTREGCSGITENSHHVEDYPGPYLPFYFAKDLVISKNELKLGGGITSHSIFVSNINVLPEFDGFHVDIIGNTIYTQGSLELRSTNGFTFVENSIESNQGFWVKAGNRNLLIKGNRIFTDPLQVPPIANNSQYVSSIYVSGSNGQNVVFAYNKIGNASSNPNTHCVELNKSSNAGFYENSFSQRVNKVIDVKGGCRDLVFKSNLGDIGTCQESPVFINAPVCPGIDASNNSALIFPFVRQNINGVGPWGC